MVQTVVDLLVVDEIGAILAYVEKDGRHVVH